MGLFLAFLRLFLGCITPTATGCGGGGNGGGGGGGGAERGNANDNWNGGTKVWLGPELDWIVGLIEEKCCDVGGGGGGANE